MGEHVTQAYDLSVIVPVYNAEAYLLRCVASLDAQTASQERFEVVLVNDGSTDSSLQLCHDIARSHKNYLVIDQENAGVSEARNVGMNAARGRYLMFLDPDDEIAASTVKELVSAFDLFGDDVDLVTYPIVYRDVATGKEHFHKRQDWLQNTGVYDLNEYPFIVQTTVNVCVKSGVAHARHFEVGHKLGEDQRFITEVLSAKAKIGYCAEATYVYWRSQDPTASLKPLTRQTFDNILENYERYLQLAHENARFARYAHALVLYEFGWRFRRKRILPEGVSLEESVECSARLARLLEDVPKGDWLESPYLTGMWVLDWALRKRDCLLVKGYFVLPSFVAREKPRVCVSLPGEVRELVLKPSSCDLGRPCLDAGMGWEFSAELPSMRHAPYVAQLEIACDGWPTYEVDLRPEFVRCNGRMLEWRIREFDDRRLVIGKDCLRVGTVKDLPVWVMPVAKRLMRVRDSFRKGKYAEPEIRELRSLLPKAIRGLRGKRLWLYVDREEDGLDGLAFRQFLNDVQVDDGIERWFVLPEYQKASDSALGQSLRFVARRSQEHVIHMLRSERILTSTGNLEQLLPCKRFVWDRLVDYSSDQVYVLLTDNEGAQAASAQARIADTICAVPERQRCSINS